MGWLPWSSGNANKASDGGRIAPDRSSRARCWEGRDLFFACLDRNEILDGIKDDKDARRKCAKEVQEFEAACSATWVCALFGVGQRMHMAFYTSIPILLQIYATQAKEYSR